MSLFQEGRLLQLDTPLSSDELLANELTGHEYISRPFLILLQMVSSNLAIDPKLVLAKPFTVKLFTGEEQPVRYFNGLVSSFTSGRIENQVRFYEAKLHPWLWFLNFRRNSRVFQNKNVLDIVEQVFKEDGYKDYDLSKVQRSQYKPRDYCVQYGESDFDFVHRLLEEEGIFYYFKHQEDKHLLILADQNSGFYGLEPNAVQYDQGSGKEYCVTSWSQKNSVYSGKVSHQDYNFETPDNNLLTQQTGTAKLYASQQLESYLYPAGHSDEAEGKNRAQIQFEAQEVNYHLYQGAGGYPQFNAGGQFNFPTPPLSSDAGNYVLLSVYHQAIDGSYLHGIEGEQIYRNSFSCFPAQVTYRPVASVAKPVVASIQTATVVGAAGHEIDTDQYGRVKVQFHWDRQGKNDDHSSCWIRVAQMWAGNQWGVHFMPRVGQEVVVQFVEGNPDRPLIVGCVYNENNQTPYTLPGSQTQSGIKTKSVGGGKDSYNELRFEDKQGAEEVYLQAQKDFVQNIKNNLNLTVGNDHALTTTSNSSIKAGKNLSHSAGEEANLSAGTNLTQNAGENVSVSAGSIASFNAGSDLNQSSGSNLNQSAGGNATVSVGKDLGHIIANNFNQSVGNNYTQTIQKSLMTTIGSSGIIEAGESFVIRVGGNSISISTAGIFINGALIKVNPT
ncbi:MAG: type VI secretion system tip protein VgrG [Proteobacteria bacterium]|nr:type VI secretion system tip protein VgrG [Pseudomonadota bacterium]